MSKKSEAQQNQAQKFPFVPRSVLLMAVEKKDKKKSGNGSKEVIIKSIAGFLDSNGFKKTLSMLLLETKIEENSWKSFANLDDIFSKLVDSSNDEEPASIEEPETLNVEEEEPKKETKEKKKKKKSNEIEEEKIVEPIEEIKEKKRKKNKKQKDEIHDNDENNNVKETIKKDKKKKKKEKKKDEKEIDEIKEVENVKDHEETKQDDGEIEEKNVSKKRKKPDSDENDENTPEMENGIDETKSGKKDKSSEPKTANAFKRVKIEDVKFADERLTDNSYWAKGGANSGYGAKAQQILEQVRGRGFRHEKTKKKRGSYRGGQIDLDSHSIKFNYSEEE